MSNVIQKHFSVTIFISALMLRLVIAALFGDATNPQLWEFGSVAKNIVNGTGFMVPYNFKMAGNAYSIILPTAYMLPLYILMIAFFFWIFEVGHTAFVSLLIVQALMGAASATLLYFIVYKMFRQIAVARYAALICVLYPPFLYAAIDFGSTTLYIFLLGILWWTTLQTDKNESIALAVTGGLIAALLSLTRGEGIFIAGGVMLWFFLKISVKQALIFFCFLLIGILPWIIRNYITFDKIIPLTSTSGMNFWRGHNPIATGTGREYSGEGIWGTPEMSARLDTVIPDRFYEVKCDRLYFTDALSFIREHPREEVMLCLRKAAFFWGLDVTHPRAKSFPYILSWGGVLLLGLFGLYHALHDHQDIWLLAAFYLTMTFVTILFFVLPRYQIILAYGLIPVSAYGLWKILHREIRL